MGCAAGRDTKISITRIYSFTASVEINIYTSVISETMMEHINTVGARKNLFCQLKVCCLPNWLVRRQKCARNGLLVKSHPNMKILCHGYAMFSLLRKMCQQSQKSHFNTPSLLNIRLKTVFRLCILVKEDGVEHFYIHL